MGANKCNRFRILTTYDMTDQMANKKGGKNGRKLYRKDFTYATEAIMTCLYAPILLSICIIVSALGLTWLASDLAPPEVYGTIIHGICKKKKKSISSISKANYGFFPPQSVRVIIILHSEKGKSLQMLAELTSLLD